MKIVSMDKVKKIKIDRDGARNLFKQVLISDSDGSPLFCFRVFTIDPGGYSPYHAHPFEHINYVIDGSGVLVTESGEEKALRKGDFALVLPNEKHRYKNVSPDRPFVMICAVPKEYE